MACEHTARHHHGVGPEQSECLYYRRRRGCRTLGCGLFRNPQLQLLIWRIPSKVPLLPLRDLRVSPWRNAVCGNISRAEVLELCNEVVLPDHIDGTPSDSDRKS